MRAGLKPLRLGLNRSARPVQSRIHLKPRVPRQLHTGLAGLLALALLAGFVAWVSAEPFWISVGHATSGTATVRTCKGSGLRLRCTGTFHAKSGRFSAQAVTMTAVPRKARQPGAAVPARMVSAGGRIAYAGSNHGLYLRWLLGLILVVMCGGGIAWATGATRLPSRRARLAASLASVVAPLLLFAGILCATW
jgi:hypothetical protein